MQDLEAQPSITQHVEGMLSVVKQVIYLPSTSCFFFSCACIFKCLVVSVCNYFVMCCSADFASQGCDPDCRKCKWVWTSFCLSFALQKLHGTKVWLIDWLWFAHISIFYRHFFIVMNSWSWYLISNFMNFMSLNWFSTENQSRTSCEIFYSDGPFCLRITTR